MARAAVPRRPRRRFLPLVAGATAVAAVATLAVAVDGYDAHEVPPLSSSVWVTRDSGQYARVNTELAEIDTVRAAEDPSGVVQNGDDGVVFTQGFGRAWPIDAANPGDLGGSSARTEGEPAVAGEATPNGTREVLQAGPWVAYLTDTGTSYLGGIADGGEVPLPVLIDPFRDVDVDEGQEPPSYVAAALAVDEDGLVALYSAIESSVRIYDARADDFRDPVEVASPPDADARLDLALVHGRWALFDAASGSLWLAGRDEPIDTGLGAEAVLQVSSVTTSRVHLADAEGLVGVDPATGDTERLAEGVGNPARPTVIAGELVAAWLSSSSGRLWTEPGGAVDLPLDGDQLEELDAILPVLRSNGERAVLNETASGMLWRVPDGKLIPVEQWSLDDENDRDEGTIQVDDVAEQEPPVAVADAFGVRAGGLVSLPLLLNDHDPNKKDVLTIVPESIQDVGDFGALSLAANNQQAVVRVAAGGGSTTFSYAVTDGVSVSPPATVTLTVVGDENTAPEWCGVDACVQEWPSPGISAGGTARVPVLSGWVDHEGDVVVLMEAVADDPGAPVSVVATAEGDVVVRHQDPNAGDAVIPVTVTVADALGAASTRTLEVRVTANPALVAEPIAVVAGVDEKISVDVTAHVRGGSGSFAIVDAVQTSTASGLVVVPNAASGRIELTAAAPGDYVVAYTVQDLQTLAQQSSVLRVIVVGAGVPLSITPITAFVRAHEDTTVDVLAAVQNTSGRVLLVSEVTSGDPDLGLSVVGQSRVRVSGSTPDGLPGRVGTATVTVTDGAGGSVQGTVTVFLVASSTASAPIAVPDTVTVRAGSQADILVLANDVSPRGERVVVHPELRGSGTEGELAFVAGDRVRYLAPSVAGVYTLRYSIYLENSPQLLDTATVTVTVLPPGTNRDPQPPILTARVVAGQSVVIPFAPSGMDPDGDRVVLADVSQPASGQGVAEIPAEGDAIVYTAPGNGVPGGQVSFGYRVRDSEGAVADGVVRVGVLAADVSDVAPLTYGDYVRVQAGTTSSLTVAPLLNDRDPLQGRLELQNVVPNAPAGTDEYARLEALLDVEAIAAGEVRVSAGDVLGVHSYVYTAVSQASFSTAEGLIVVNVTDAPSPDAPLVVDTVVTAQNRGQLGSGLDVVTGKVQWASGDPAGLELAIWGPATSRYTVDGPRIAGSLPARGDIVPFSLTGVGAGGGAVVSYGFLLIPALDDMRIQLRPGTQPLTVPEEQSREFAVRELLDLAASDDVELRDDDEFAVQRANASCAPVASTRVGYSAGREAPWTDTCTVAVRIAGQETWTLLGVPVLIEPKDPQAILSSLSRTIPPGASDSVDLYDQMTSWEGGRVGDPGALDYSIVYSGTSFIVTHGHDGKVAIDVRADARPGTRESIRVSVGAYGGLTAGISLVVGIAPPDAPRGATFSQQCDVSRGATCAITVVDKSGEYDPFAGKAGSGLTLVGVGAAGAGAVTCPIATVRAADERQVVATWPAGPKPVGGECVVTYTVADAQGRTGQGQLTIDVLGYPQRPTTLGTAAYTPTTVTVDVTLGDARNAHPAMEGIVLYRVGGGLASDDCVGYGPNTYRCTIIGLENGQHARYTARAINSIGESPDSSELETWSYREPEISPVSGTAKYRPTVTTDQLGVVELSIPASPDAETFRVTEGGNLVGTIRRNGTTTTGDVTRIPGTHTLTVTPISRFSPPPIRGDVASNEGDPRTLTVTFIGSPTVSGGSPQPGSDGTSIIFQPTIGANNSPDLQVTYYAWNSGNPTCIDDGAGNQLPVSAAHTSTSSPITGLDPNSEYSVGVCVSNGFGTAPPVVATGYTFLAPTPIPAGLSYSVPMTPSESGGGLSPKVYGYGPVSAPALPAADRPGFTAYFLVGGARDQDLATLLSPGASSVPVEAVYCTVIGSATVCDDQHATGIGWAGAPSTVSVTFPACWDDGGDSEASPTWSIVAFSGGAGAFAHHTAPTDEGAGVYRYTITSWGGDFALLDPIAHDVPRCLT